jgi:hypothetical protein
MYTHVWNKYLPIIKILLKRSATGDQTLDMNRIDFERAASGRKGGYKFNIEFSHGRVDNMIKSSPIACDLAAVLLRDDSIKDLFRKNDYQVSLNTKFQLAIKHTSLPQPTDTVEGSETASAEKEALA